MNFPLDAWVWIAISGTAVMRGQVENVTRDGRALWLRFPGTLRFTSDDGTQAVFDGLIGVLRDTRGVYRERMTSVAIDLALDDDAGVS